MSSQDAKKRAVAEAAVDLIEVGQIVGVGTGSTANHFIDALARIRGKIDGTVASSEATAAALRDRGLPVLELNAVEEVSIYVDGADEATRNLHLIKGGGGALTREKVVAAAARRFVCVVDDSKVVAMLGRFPLPVEVIPMARSHVARQIVKLGGDPVWREGFETDNGNVVLDVHHLDLTDPVRMETELNQLAGVVSNGLFARRPADALLLGGDQGVEILVS